MIKVELMASFLGRIHGHPIEAAGVKFAAALVFSAQTNFKISVLCLNNYG